MNSISDESNKIEKEDTKNNKLNLQIYIRSSDFFLANNWNTLTGALLVNMICNLKDINI